MLSDREFLSRTSRSGPKQSHWPDSRCYCYKTFKRVVYRRKLVCEAVKTYAGLKFWPLTFCPCNVQFWFDFLYVIHVYNSALVRISPFKVKMGEITRVE
jgi:hypothetical protein